MVRTLSVLLALCVACEAFQSPEALAQGVPSPYSFVEEAQSAGVFAGYVSADAGQFGFGPTGGVAYGARYGIEVSGPLGLDGVFTFFPTQRDVIDPRRQVGNRKVAEANAELFMVDARFRFNLTGRRAWHSLSPYLFAGGGVAYNGAGDRPEDQAVPSEARFEFGTEFLGVLGAGVRLITGDRFQLRGEGHLTLWQLETPDAFEDPDLDPDFAVSPSAEWVNNGALTVGIGYRF